MTQGRKLRIVQIVGIVYVLFLFLMVRTLPAATNQGAMTPFKWVIVAAALFCAGDGFYMQKRLLRAPRNPRAASKSTPAGRWMLANIVRYTFAISVSLWGLLLHFQGGPDSLANVLVGLGLVLLLFFKPGPIPGLEPQGNG